MSKSELSELTVKALLGLTIFEVISTVAFELLGRPPHSTQPWIAAMVAGCIVIIVKGSFEKKK